MNEKDKLNRIYVKRGTGLKLAKILKCTPVMVCEALAGRKKSELAIKIRHVALTQYNGKEIK